MTVVPLNAHVDLNVLMRSLYARRHEAVTVLCVPKIGFG
jgi:hypothetical protein